MPLYAYQAVDAGGHRTRGRLSAATAQALIRDLEGRGLLALNVDEATEKATSGGLGLGFGRRNAVLEFTRAVGALLPAGMPLAKALAAGATTAPASIRPTLDAVRVKVERGDELAAALAEYPGLFTSLYVGIVRAGEKSGSLDKAFVRLADHLERESELRSKLISMSIYPVLLALVGAGAVLVLVFFVLPRFADLLLDSGATLPATAGAIVDVTTWLRVNWRFLAVIPPAFLVALAWLRTSESGRRFSSNALIHLPVVGNWRKQTLAAAFARMVGELLTGGAPLLMAL
ncbi:MAG: type II secretion system F family protein [Gemmatimonadetes bacterium]|nr:type II secretion system F family protein [Gemmatimonadota bacterium]